jgi:hypothetical protein
MTSHSPEVVLAQAICDLTPVELDSLRFERSIHIPTQLTSDGAVAAAQEILSQYSLGDALALVERYQER